MLNQIFENNGVNGTETPWEDPSPSRCYPAQQRGLAGNKIGEKEECLNQQRIVCAIRQRQLEMMSGFPNLKIM